MTARMRAGAQDRFLINPIEVPEVVWAAAGP